MCPKIWLKTRGNCQNFCWLQGTKQKLTRCAFLKVKSCLVKEQELLASMLSKPQKGVPGLQPFWLKPSSLFPFADTVDLFSPYLDKRFGPLMGVWRLVCKALGREIFIAACLSCKSRKLLQSLRARRYVLNLLRWSVNIASVETNKEGNLK